MTKFLWFCLDHVREYNAAWNYYEGMSETEIEVELRKDAIWHRPTWPLRGWPDERYHDPFGLFDDRPERSSEEQVGRWGWRSGDAEALAVLDLRPPVTVASIKQRYKELVKRHHPDANGGDSRHEERLKEINRAYGRLMESAAA
ncbi:MAG: J domain-containing protein [Alphaproteobacteria bacterium]